MAIDITSATSQPTTTRARTNEQTVTTPNGGSNSVVAPPSSRGDTVQLSEAAQTLRDVERRLADTPDVDSARVESIRQQIDDGTYEINPDRIAERILDFDNLL